LGDHARPVFGQLAEEQDLALKPADPIVVLDVGRWTLLVGVLVFWLVGG